MFDPCVVAFASPLTSARSNSSSPSHRIGPAPISRRVGTSRQPTPLPVVHYDAKAGERSLDVLRWGLVPFWAKDIKVGFSNINAKAEGIGGKPAFREAFQRRHCFVPVDNFYDCKKATGGKRPYAIAFADPQRS